MLSLFKKKKKVEHKQMEYKLDTAVKRFSAKLENKKKFDEKLYENILRKSIAYNKKEILGDMIKQIQVFDDYDEEEANFNYIPFLQKLKQVKLDKQ